VCSSYFRSLDRSMVMKSTASFRFDIAWSILVASICGALAGATAGFLTESYEPLPSAPIMIPSGATSTVPAVTPTTTEAGITIVPIERRPVELQVPPAFVSRRASPVASLYRKPKGVSIDERFLGEDRLLGEAIALTSDGWFVTTEDVFADLKIADLTLWINGTSYVVDRAVHDKLNATVFLKTSANSLTASPFANLSDLGSGSAVWVEARAGEFEPRVVVTSMARTEVNAVFSSEEAHRRIQLTGQAEKGERGSAVWDPNGSLIGLVERTAGESLRVVPASTIATSFGSLLSTGEIRHASLGVRSLDLGTLLLEGSRGALPEAGAWIRDDKKTGKVAITKDSSAAKGGLKTGDVILRVERDILDGSLDLGEVLADYRPGASVTLRVWRDGIDFDLPVTLGSVTTSEALK
jgi:S1-C subfamily serine protease